MEKISVIVPVYNEEKTILEVIKGIREIKVKNASKEIIIIDDFSTDGTRAILKKIKGNFTKIFYHKKNMGKGAAIRTALKHATGTIIAIQDADLEYSPKNIANLIVPILDGSSEVVYGSRFRGKKLMLSGKSKTPLPLHWIGNRVLTLITNLLYFSSITDMETGNKIFKKGVIKGITLKATRFDFEPEITAKILKRGCKIKELPIDFNPRSFEEGKKITWRDGIKAAYYLLKYRFFD
ncbi:MAG: glycosyltransferase family 2 protein [Nanoarchaeota archaeon]|nr:glycosyltransferase family 2 protein [Nanoarchaeota archaeon]